MRKTLEDDGKYFIKALLPSPSKGEKGVRTSAPISVNFMKCHITVALYAFRAESEQVRALKATARKQAGNRKDERWNVRQELQASCHRSKQ